MRDMTIKHPKMPNEEKEFRAEDILLSDQKFLDKGRERARTRRRIDLMHPAAVERQYPSGTGTFIGEWPRYR